MRTLFGAVVKDLISRSEIEGHLLAEIRTISGCEDLQQVSILPCKTSYGGRNWEVIAIPNGLPEKCIDDLVQTVLRLGKQFDLPE